MVALSGYWAAIALKLAVQWRRQAPAWHSRRTAVGSALEDGVRVVDARSVDDFTTGHLRGSVNVGFDGRFAETRGMVANIGDRIALITYPGEEQGAALRLARVGSDNAVGYLTVDRDGVFPAELRDLVRTAPRTSVAELDGRRARRGIALGGHDLRRLEGSNAFQARTVRIYCRGRGANRPQRGGRHPSSPRQPLPHEPVDCRSWPVTRLGRRAANRFGRGAASGGAPANAHNVGDWGGEHNLRCR